MANERQLNLDKKDVELLLEVNKKAIELQTETSSQYEDLIEGLEAVEKENRDNRTDIIKIKEIASELDATVSDLKKEMKSDIEKLDSKLKEIKDSMFKTGVLISAGIISLVVQIIEIFIHFKK
jgi:chromosome segregation ATPase